MIRYTSGELRAKRAILVVVSASILLVTGRSEIIPPTRRIAWIPGDTVGVPGGIPNRTNIHTTLAAGSTAAQINSAIASCPADRVVKLAAGTYNLTTHIDFGFKKNVTLRGEGTNTVLRAANNISQFVFIGGDFNWPAPKNITAGWVAGSTNLTLDNVSSLTVGMLVRVDQLAVPGLTWDRTGNASSREINQMTRITKISGNTVTLYPPIYYGNGGSPQLHPVLDHANLSGVEDMVLEVNGQGVGYGIVFWQSYGCWARNVLMTNINNYNIMVGRSLQAEIAKCTMIDSPNHGPNHTGILIGPTAEKASASGVLAYDNIIHRIFPGVELNSSSGNVIAYNFVNDAFYDNFGQGVGIDVNHMGHCMFNLVEGNVVNTIQNDGYFGSSSHNTYFRNWAHGFVTVGLGGQPSSFNSAPIKLNHYSLYENIIGNILGHPTITPALYSPSTSDYPYSTPVIYQFGYPAMGHNGFTGTFSTDAESRTTGEDTRRDLRVESTAIIHGNWDKKTGTQVWAPSIPDQSVPQSLYLTGRPSWFRSLDWPPVNPANGLAGMNFTVIPAGFRFVNGTEPPQLGGDTTSPSVPSGLVAVPAGPNQISLSWSASTDNVGVAGYRVERSVGAGATNFVQVGLPTIAKFDDAGLTPSTVYNYRVRAVDGAGNLSAYSAAVPSTTAAPAVNQPPTVGLTSPAGGSSAYAPSVVTLTASAADSDGSVAKVEFFEGLNKVGEDTSAPYSVAMNASTARSYVVTAVAHDNSGAAVLSASVVFTAVQPGIATAQRLPNGSFNIVAAGTAGRTNSVHVSSDLVNWTLLTNLINVGGTVNLVDAEAAILNRRFYRIWAESLFLSNVVGFARVTVPPGYSIIANQFIQPTNTVAAVITGVPGGTSLSKFRPTTGDFAINNYDPVFLSWLDPNQSFANGDTGFLLNPTTNSFSLTFQGQVPQGLLSLGLPAGYSMVGSLLPQTGGIQSQLGFPGASGDTVFLYRDGRYRTSQFDPLLGGWDFEPNVNVGEGFFLFKSAATNWVRSFSAYN